MEGRGGGNFTKGVKKNNNNKNKELNNITERETLVSLVGGEAHHIGAIWLAITKKEIRRKSVLDSRGKY